MSTPQGATDLWNGMIVPLLDFPIRGVIWYQGEETPAVPWQYRTLLPAMIQCWRDGWKNPKMPFLIVQLAPYQNADSPWYELRDVSFMSAKRCLIQGSP